MPSEEGLSEYERWQLYLAAVGLAFSLGFTLWIMTKEGNAFYRVRWEIEQRRKHREWEKAFAKARNLMLYQAYEVVTGANAQQG